MIKFELQKRTINGVTEYSIFGVIPTERVISPRTFQHEYTWRTARMHLNEKLTDSDLLCLHETVISINDTNITVAKDLIEKWHEALISIIAAPCSVTPIVIRTEYGGRFKP